jgi:hypothetical protein
MCSWPFLFGTLSNFLGTLFFLKKRAFTFLECVPYRSFGPLFFTGIGVLEFDVKFSVAVRFFLEEKLV